MNVLEMKAFADSLLDSGLSRKDMVESYESLVRRCKSELFVANQQYQFILFNKHSKKEKKEKLDLVNKCMDEYLKAFDELRAIKLFYKKENQDVRRS